MAFHRARAFARALRRHGAEIVVRHKFGTHDPVTATRTAAQEIEVRTAAVFRRPTQKSQQGDPLSTQDTFYLVPVAPFRGMFVPRDADLVLDGTAESRVLSVRTRIVSGEEVAYELYVSGVAA